MSANGHDQTRHGRKAASRWVELLGDGTRGLDYEGFLAAARNAERAAAATGDDAGALAIRLMQPMTIALIETLRAEEARGTPQLQSTLAIPTVMAWVAMNALGCVFADPDTLPDDTEAMIEAFATAARGFAATRVRALKSGPHVQQP